MNQTGWQKVSAIEEENGGKRNILFPLDCEITVGFGYAALERDGVPMFTEDTCGDHDVPLTGAQAEAMAASDPDHDWRIELWAPLYGQTYQRHAPGEWVLIKKSKGFA